MFHSAYQYAFDRDDDDGGGGSGDNEVGDEDNFYYFWVLTMLCVFHELFHLIFTVNINKHRCYCLYRDEKVRLREIW